jgi:hypothetical protein
LSEPETNKKPSSNRSTKDRRNTLFRVFDGVLSLSHTKIHNGSNSDRAKQGWARVLVSAVSVYGPLLKDEELELSVLSLEEKLKISVLIPKPETARTTTVEEAEVLAKIGYSKYMMKSQAYIFIAD